MLHAALGRSGVHVSAQFGTSVLWTVFLSIPCMVAIQRLTGPEPHVASSAINNARPRANEVCAPMPSADEPAASIGHTSGSGAVTGVQRSVSQSC